MMRHVCKVGLLAAACVAAGAALSAENSVLVEIDRAQILRLDEPAGSIILGNPSVADATVQDVRTLVLTGKSVGSTNIIILDGDGREILNRVIEVLTPTSSAMTMFKGPVRESYACAPNCEPTLRAGDGVDYFKNVLASNKARNDEASGTGAVAGD